MPTILRWNGYRFFFYSADGREPAHVHISKDEKEAKIWLHDLAVAVNVGYSGKELNELVRTTGDEREQFLKAWHDYFADRN
ncbi:MAG: DUF4160 domain-containing protein [Beijerinckiaceae bacterium]